MSWFERIVPSIRTDNSAKNAAKNQMPEGLWFKCKQCDSVLYRSELERSAQVCPKCSHHHPIHALERIELLLDENDRIMLAENVSSKDPLKFRDSKRYRDRMTQSMKVTNEALQVCKGKMHGLDVVLAAFEFRFMGGSMGSVVGERFVRGVNAALEQRSPFICVTTSGGARMQEALISLFQMAKTSAALARLSDAGLPYIVVLTHPTTGGVSASLAMLGDVNIAEPGALIGFAGPRVIEQTVKQTLPEGFQRSEFLLEHGVVDAIIDRRELKDRLHSIASVLMRKAPQITAEQSTETDEK